MFQRNQKTEVTNNSPFIRNFLVRLILIFCWRIDVLHRPNLFYKLNSKWPCLLEIQACTSHLWVDLWMPISLLTFWWQIECTEVSAQPDKFTRMGPRKLLSLLSKESTVSFLDCCDHVDIDVTEKLSVSITNVSQLVFSRMVRRAVERHTPWLV